ncbi:hypothetical protein [Nisaea sp.]|uniref:hypothetical protein n=1 Tax=Nisaea sp. TaxID=2024842 RepID=UPI002B276B71|nr:hypothetical protein [Nisaea sp.]
MTYPIDYLRTVIAPGDRTEARLLLSERALAASKVWTGPSAGIAPRPTLRSANAGPLNGGDALKQNGMTSAGSLHVIDLPHGLVILVSKIRAFGNEGQGNARSQTFQSQQR